MALLYFDGFDTYNSATDAGQSIWATGGLSGLSMVAGRFGLPGKGVNTGYGGGFVRYTASLGANYSTLYTGFAVSGNTFLVGFEDGTSEQLYASVSGSTVVIYRGSTLLAQSVTGVVPQTGWYFVEFGATISSTAGSATVKINGNTVLSITGANTQNTANAWTNGVGFYNCTIDDFYVCDSTTGAGTYPCNTFLGDKRVRTVYPSGNGATIQFTPPGPLTLGNSTLSDQRSFNANTIVLTWSNTPAASLTNAVSDPHTGVAPRMLCDGNITTLAIYATTNYPAAKVKPVIIACDPVSLLPTGTIIYGNETIGLSNGSNTLTFPGTGVAVSKDVCYSLGYVSDTALTIWACGEAANNYSDASAGASYTALPATVNFSWSTSYGWNAITVTYTLVPAPNYGAVSEDYADGDSGYNSSATAGALDLFTTNPALPSGATVYAVKVQGEYRKDDAGTRSVYNLLKSGTIQANGPAHNLGTSYQVFGDIWVTDPNTSASWTTPAANAIGIGYEVAS